MENKFDMEAFLKGAPTVDAYGVIRRVARVSESKKLVTYRNVRRSKPMENKFDMEAFLKGTPVIDASDTVRKIVSVADDWVTYINVRNGNRYSLTINALKIKAESSGWRMHVEPVKPVKPVKPESEKRRKPNARRDSFARAAMQSLIGQSLTIVSPPVIATTAVRIADALISELDK